MLVEASDYQYSSETKTEDSDKQSDDQMIDLVPQINGICIPKTQTSKIKKISRRPTPFNLQFEEIPDLTTCQYDICSLEEWNIPALIEYRIQVCSMVIHNCKL